MDKNRLDYISVLRVSAMILVVFYHCLCGYSDIWSGGVKWQTVPMLNDIACFVRYFHMPLFIIISGFLYSYLFERGRYVNTIQFVCKKVKRVMIPYLFWALYVTLFQNFHYSEILNGVAHLWFLLFIFEAYISMYIFDKCINSKYAYGILYAISFLSIAFSDYIVGFIGMRFTLGLFFYVRFMPYYIIGIALHRIISKTNISSNLIYGSLFIAVLLFISLFICTSNQILLRLVALFVVVSVFFAVKAGLHINISEKFKQIDKCCMGIYIIHHILIQEMNTCKLLHPYMGHYVLYPLLQFFIVLFLSFYLTRMALKFKMTSLVIGG